MVDVLVAVSSVAERDNDGDRGKTEKRLEVVLFVRVIEATLKRFGAPSNVIISFV
jgi:hypothetical protein